MHRVTHKTMPNAPFDLIELKKANFTAKFLYEEKESKPLGWAGAQTMKRGVCEIREKIKACQAGSFHPLNLGWGPWGHYWPNCTGEKNAISSVG